jgi:hypothetical protein
MMKPQALQELILNVYYFKNFQQIITTDPYIWSQNTASSV